MVEFFALLVHHLSIEHFILRRTLHLAVDCREVNNYNVGEKQFAKIFKTQPNNTATIRGGFNGLAFHCFTPLIHIFSIVIRSSWNIICIDVICERPLQIFSFFFLNNHFKTLFRMAKNWVTLLYCASDAFTEFFCKFR